jgi:hypothetical protein
MQHATSCLLGACTHHNPEVGDIQDFFIQRGGGRASYRELRHSTYTSKGKLREAQRTLGAAQH